MKFYDFGEVIDKDSRYVIFGIPWDYLSSIELANSATAPDQVRTVSTNLALTTELGFEIPKLLVVDKGNIPIKVEEVKDNLEKIEEFVDDLFSEKDDIIPIMIGGDHFCSYPVVKAVNKHITHKKEFGILIFDSHLDLYYKWDKGVYSHATVSHRIFELDNINNSNLLIAGTRDIDVPELQIAKENDIKYIDAHLLHEQGIHHYTQNIINFFKESGIKELYISVDVDVLDPSVAPGTGYAIPGGFSYRELWYILREISKSFKIQGFDFVEVSPSLDLKNNMTSVVAAKIIIELISFISKRNH